VCTPRVASAISLAKADAGHSVAGLDYLPPGVRQETSMYLSVQSRQEHAAASAGSFAPVDLQLPGLVMKTSTMPSAFPKTRPFA